MLDTSGLISSMLFTVLPFILLFVVISFFKSPFMKGKMGEGIVNFANTVALDEEVYIPLKNITLKLADGSTTQIDHVLVSKYGIFVIETKNMNGWIYGDERQKRWTQQNFKQNHRHIKALEEILGLLFSIFVSIIVFVGDCKFKTVVPPNVFLGMPYTRFIHSFTQGKLDAAQMKQIIDKLQSKRLGQSFQTDRVHVQNLKEQLEQTGIKKCIQNADTRSK